MNAIDVGTAPEKLWGREPGCDRHKYQINELGGVDEVLVTARLVRWRRYWLMVTRLTAKAFLVSVEKTGTRRQAMTKVEADRWLRTRVSLLRAI